MKAGAWRAVFAGTALGAVSLLADQTNAPPKTTGQLALEEKIRRQEEQLNTAWAALSTAEKQAAWDWHRNISSLPTAEQAIIRERIVRYTKLKPEEQQQLKRNYERWALMTGVERERARQEYRRRRYEYETKWRKEHPNVPPPPFQLNPAPARAANTNQPAAK